MTTQYTPILKLALPVQGELSGTWGDVVNDNITSMVEQAIAGRSVIDTWPANSHVLTTANGVTAESRAAMLSLTDSGTALTGAGSVICPALSKTYIVKNGTAQVITVKTAAGSGIAVPVGKTMLVYCDGTNVLEAVDHVVTLSAGTLTITGLTTFASLKGTGATTVTNILDEDNMASDSATAIATQQSIKAYVDSQVGTVDTLSEILANGNTTGANDIDVDGAQKVQFRDAAIYINSSVDGQLDIVADTEIQIAATTIDINGAVVLDGAVTGATNITLSGELDAATGVFSGAVDVNGALDVLGTTNLDAVDIDGATQIDSTLTVGVDDTGYDVKFFGATSGKSLLWDGSADSLIVTGTAQVANAAIASVAISGVSRASNTVTVTNSADHGLSGGDIVSLNGVTDESFNGYFTVGSISSSVVFTFTQVAADATSSGGYTTEIVYSLLSSGTALSSFAGPVVLNANSVLDGLQITQTGTGDALNITGTITASGVATLASLVATTADINAGTIDGTTIGGTTAAAGTFTTLNTSALSTFAGLVKITDETGLAAAGVPLSFGYSSAVGTLYTGDGTGYTFQIAKRTGGVTTPFFSILDTTGAATFSSAITAGGASSGATLTTGTMNNSGAGGNTKAALDFKAAGTVYARIKGGYGAANPELAIDVGGTDRLTINGSTGAATFSSTVAAANAGFLAGTRTKLLTDGSGDSVIGGAAGSNNLYLHVNDAAVLTMTAGAATFSGAVKANGATTTAGLNVLGTATEASTLATSVTQAAVFITPLNSSSWGMAIGSYTGNGQYIQAVSQAGTETKELRLQPFGGDVYVGGAAVFGAGITATTGTFSNNTSILPTTDGDALIVGKSSGAKLYFFNNASASLITNAAGAGAARDGFQITSGNVLTEIDTVAKLSVSAAEVVVNDTGADTDFRVESDTNTHALFVQGSDGNVGIGTSSPTANLSVGSITTATGDVTLRTTKTTFSITPSNTDAGGVELGVGWVAGGQGPMKFSVGSERMRIDASGNVGIGNSAPEAKLSILGGSLPTASSGYSLSLSSELSATRLTTDASSRTSFIGSYYDDTSLEISQGVTAGYTSGIVLGARSATNATVSDAIAFYTRSTERMRIDASGSLGLGVVPSAWAPSVYKAIQLGTSNGVGVIAARVDAVNEVNFGLNWYYDGGTNVEYTASSHATNYAQVNGAHKWQTAAVGTAGANITWTDAMTLDASGRLLIGKAVTTDSAMLEVLQAAAGTTTVALANSHATTPYGMLVDFTGGSPDNNVNSFLHCRDTTTNRLFIYSDGDVMNHDGTYGTISDERIKQDFTVANSQWDDIKGLQFYNYRKKDDVLQYGDDAPIELGVKAQEAELVSAGLVKEYALSENQAGLHPDFEDWENGTVKGVKYSIMFMKATVALQEAMARIESLEARITALEGA
jgi:hypothetical protein